MTTCKRSQAKYVKKPGVSVLVLYRVRIRLPALGQQETRAIACRALSLPYQGRLLKQVSGVRSRPNGCRITRLSASVRT